MKELLDDKLKVMLLAMVVPLVFIFSLKSYADLAYLPIMIRPHHDINAKTRFNSNYKIPSRGYEWNLRSMNRGIVHKTFKRWLHGKPAVVNVLIINPASGAVIKPSNGSYFINSVRSVKDIVNLDTAFAGINASYFKPDSGTPLGTCINEGKIITGPLYKRVTFGVTQDKKFVMQRINIKGDIRIGDNLKLSLFNVNQPVFSRKSFSVFTDQFGRRTPKTSSCYSHIVVEGNKIAYIKNSSVLIPRGGFVLVGPHNMIAKFIKVGDKADYIASLSPSAWDNVEYAIGGGPYLIKNGKIYIDKQNFTKHFLWDKSPRTAIGYTKSGTLIMLTVDGRRRGVSEGATMTEVAQIMKEFGAYYAMNLDGGTSTQMVVGGKVVDLPTVRGGSKVTNALVIIAPVLAAKE